MRAYAYGAASAAAGSHLASAISLNVNSTQSIKNASAALAYNLMSWYHNNQSSTAPVAVGTLPAPLYWWEAGAVWGGMIDYWAYTNDSSYVYTVQQALMAQSGTGNDFMDPAYYASTGNDDQAFWALATLSAMEYGFPVPSGNSSSTWLDLSRAVFDLQAARWDTSTCNGGLRWQVFSYNAGYNYKNSVSNGAFFQIAARLARYTGNNTYIDWAEKTWNWMSSTGLISPDFHVFDGTNDDINCTQINHEEWAYNPALLLYGTSMLYNSTNGSQVWEKRTTGLLEAISTTFFSPFANATNIMFQPTCELSNTCDNDQLSFKAYLSRWMAKSAVVAPYITSSVTDLLTVTAEAAIRSCSGGQDNATCGTRWYVDGYDGNYGVGQELSGLETVQSLLLLHDAAVEREYPMTSEDVVVSEESSPTSTLTLPPKTSTASASPSKSHGAASSVCGRDTAGLSWGLLTPVIASMLLGGWVTFARLVRSAVVRTFLLARATSCGATSASGVLSRIDAEAYKSSSSRSPPLTSIHRQQSLPNPLFLSKAGITAKRGSLLFEVPIGTTGNLVATRPAPKTYLLTFRSPPDNRLTTPFCQALLLALDILELRYEPGVVITTSGIDKFYSNGLDLTHASFTPGFFPESLYKSWARLLTYPMPTVALLNGHAFAGALMLAMMHDYRIMNPHKGYLCLNELDLGVPLRPPMTGVFRQKVSAQTYRKLVLEAQRFKALEALKEGIVDWLGGLEEALAHIDELKLVQKAQKGMSGVQVYGDLKREMWRETVGYLETFGQEDQRQFMIEAKKRREREEAERRVKGWEGKAKL